MQLDIKKRIAKIIAKRKTLLDKLKIYSDEMKIIQDECTHPNAVKINKSNTGNYCPQDDHYWRECSCPDCLKTWTEDQ